MAGSSCADCDFRWPRCFRTRTSIRHPCKADWSCGKNARMRPGRAGPHRRPCSCRFLRQVLVARRMWQAMRPKLRQYQPVIARLQPQLLPRRPAPPTAQILSSETAAIPIEAAMTRTPVSAATNRHMGVARGSGKACARTQRNGGSRAFCRALLVRRCQRPSVVRQRRNF